MTLAQAEQGEQAEQGDANGEIPAEGGDASAEGVEDGRITTFVTTAHRQFVKARDKKYDQCQQHFFDSVAKLRMHYEQELEAEQAWEKNWATMVEYLQKDDTP